MNATSNPDDASDRMSAGAITKAIREAERRVRRRFPWLRHQTALGMGLVVAAYATAATSAWLYLNGLLPWWGCVPINAVCFAVLREIEHDLIHDLYFIGRRAIQNVVLFLIWPAIGNLPNPLYRRKIHLRHHRSSGQEDDLEERLIGNGASYGPLRLLTMLDTGLSLPFRQKELASIPGFHRAEMLRALFPVNTAYYAVWLSFLAYHAATFAAGLFGVTLELPAALASLLPFVNAAAMVWVVPNAVRQAGLAVLSSTMHYFGDVKTTVQQTQVLSRWYWEPLQVLSMNFGKSHAIHHFVVNQPFYLRELVRRDAHAAMRRHGVRFDDAGTFRRANRWGAPAAAPAAAAAPSRARTRPVADILFVELEGKLDGAAAARLEASLLEAIERGERRLAVDLSRVESISDSGLRVLLRAARALIHADGKLVLHSLNDRMTQLFRRTGLASVLPIHASRRAAEVTLSATGYATAALTAAA